VFCFGRGSGPDLTSALGIASDGSLPYDPTNVTSEPSTLVQTGGTTGLPKLVHHTHRFYAGLRTFADYYRAGDAPRLRHLLQSGTWHISSQTAAFMTLFSGGTLFLKQGIQNGPFLELIAKERINSGFIAPPGLYQLLDDQEMIDNADLSSMQTLTLSGSAAAPSRLRAAAERLGPVIRVVYGMTESPMIAAMPNVAYDPEHPERMASCGLPFGDTRIEIRDGDGKSLPAGEPGDIWVASTMNMAEYYGAPEATRQVLVDGWLRTGDIGTLDDNGYLYIVDREKDMVITGIGSSNVFCKPVEDVLMTQPSVRRAAVIGVPDPVFGERVHAYIVAAPGSELTGDQLREHMLGQLNERWTPTSWDFIDALPLTSSAKVDKKALRERYVAEHSIPAGSPQ
jgi:acyl-CoA synthetase (AMP-forming)/AMP-acid ligase II